MNMGQRIADCLSEKNWKQIDLLRHVPDLDAASLSAIIKRDSKHSKFSTRIAMALGVNHDWLMEGLGPKWRDSRQPDHSHLTPRQQALLGLFDALPKSAQDEVMADLAQKKRTFDQWWEEMSEQRKGKGKA